MKKKKQRRNPKPQNDDIISALSDELLLHILSFLPAAIAVATSLLSHRWRHLWDNLLVSYFHFDDGHRQIDFIKLVNGVVNRRKEPNVRKLHLLCPSSTVHHIQNQIATCIDAALGPHLQEISLTLSSPCFFPHCLFRCKSLVSLHLQCRQMHVGKVCNVYDLPSLKKLVLKLCSANCIRPLLLCCPNLETLELDFNQGIPYYMDIGMLKLKSLTLLGLGERAYNITINTPLLEYLNINIESTKCITLSLTSSLQNLVHAHLNIVHLHHIRDVVYLLQKIYMAQSLSFNVSKIKYYHDAWRKGFPQFHHLVRLELIVNYLDSSFVMDLLQRCSVLEFLHLHCLKWKYYRKKNKRTWREPRVAPSCVELHLKDVEFRGYCDFKQERGLLAYILEKGHVLKKMKIFHDLKMSASVDIRKQQILESLSSLPRSSNTCQLLFD